MRGPKIRFRNPASHVARTDTYRALPRGPISLGAPRKGRTARIWRHEPTRARILDHAPRLKDPGPFRPNPDQARRLWIAGPAPKGPPSLGTPLKGMASRIQCWASASRITHHGPGARAHVSVAGLGRRWVGWRGLAGVIAEDRDWAGFASKTPTANYIVTWHCQSKSA